MKNDETGKKWSPDDAPPFDPMKHPAGQGGKVTPKSSGPAFLPPAAKLRTSVGDRTPMIPPQGGKTGRTSSDSLTDD